MRSLSKIRLILYSTTLAVALLIAASWAVDVFTQPREPQVRSFDQAQPETEELHLTPAQLEPYLAAARRIEALALGVPQNPEVKSVPAALDNQQGERNPPDSAPFKSHGREHD